MASDIGSDGNTSGLDALSSGSGTQGGGAVAATTVGAADGMSAAAGSARAVQVSISIAAPAGSSVPQSLQRSSRQIASAVRRAIGPY